MTTYREHLIDRMTHIYGLENPIVIEFCRYCEEWADNDWNNKILKWLVDAHAENPVFEEDV